MRPDIHARFLEILTKVNAQIAAGQLPPRPVVRSRYHVRDLGARLRGIEAS